MGTARNFVACLFVGACLLVTLSACETSKHAEIMSTEDLRAQAQEPAVPVAPAEETESEQVAVPFEGKPVPSAGLSEPLVFAPEPPPSPAPPAPEPKPAPPAPEPKPAPPAPEPKPAPPAPEPKPAPPAPEPKPVPPAPEPKPVPPAPEPKPVPPAPEPKPVPPAPEPKPVPPAPEPKPVPPAPEPAVEKSVPAEEPVAEPEMEIAKLEPDDFVAEPEPPAPEPPAPEPVVESGLSDVFFDYDQYAIRSDAVPILEKDAELLKSTYKDSGVLIEGHCDERGTVEYNLELGKRRAQAVKDYLVDLGIDESRIRIVSYGKERPFCTESKPSCWRQNRRGHFVRQ